MFSPSDGVLEWNIIVDILFKVCFVDRSQGGDKKAPLRRAETAVPQHSGVLCKGEPCPLRIVECSDDVSAKLQSTKDKVSKLFEFEKPFGKQTQMLIKSQALQKPNSLLT